MDHVCAILQYDSKKPNCKKKETSIFRSREKKSPKKIGIITTGATTQRWLLPGHRLDGVAQDLGVGHAVGAELLEPVHPEAVELGPIPGPRKACVAGGGGPRNGSSPETSINRNLRAQLTSQKNQHHWL